MSDKRIVKSSRAFRSAYETLIEKTDPATITIRELCREAGLNRATFYNHYGFLENFEYELIAEQIRIVCRGHHLKGLTAPLSPEHLEKAISAYIDSFVSNDIIMTLIKSLHSEHYCRIMVDAQLNFTLNSLYDFATPHAKDHDALVFDAYFQNSAVFSTIIRWIQSGMKLPRKQLADIILAHCAVMNERILRLTNRPDESQPDEGYSSLSS